MNNKKLALCDIITVSVTVIIMLFFAVGIFAFPRKSFSEDENRPLADAPKFDTNSLMSGRYFERLSEFYSDSIPLRTSLIRTKAYFELMLGKAQNNGVVFMPDGRLVDRCEYADLTALKRNADTLASLGFDALAIIPRSADIYTDSDDAERTRSTVYSITGGSELFEKLKQAPQDVYYKTDHHLNSEGAYIVYCHIVSSLGVTPYPRSAFREESFSNGFLGTTYSKSGLLPTAYDTVTLWRYDGDTDYTVICEDKGCTLHSLYAPEAAALKDKYRVFTNGNHGILHIRGGTNRPTLLIIKDSFANAVLPLLARHFDLTVYDPRYTNVPLPECDFSTAIVGIDTLNGIYFSFKKEK